MLIKSFDLLVLLLLCSLFVFDNTGLVVVVVRVVVDLETLISSSLLVTGLIAGIAFNLKYFMLIYEEKRFRNFFIFQILEALLVIFSDLKI